MINLYRLSKNMVNRKIVQIKKLIIAALVIIVGLILFKFIPMSVFGKDILWDASSHISITILVLYTLWFFIDQNKSWRVPYFIFAFAVLAVISVHRMMVNAHNDIGLLAGLVLGVLAIFIAELNNLKGKLRF